METRYVVKPGYYRGEKHYIIFDLRSKAFVAGYLWQSHSTAIERAKEMNNNDHDMGQGGWRYREYETDEPS
jgi:hypothetical protein